MTVDDLILLARQAGAQDDGFEVRFKEPRYLERFAALVAAAEREACARVAEEGLIGHTIAKAIRARGQDPMPLFDDWPGGWRK